MVFLIDAVNPKQAKVMSFLQTLHTAKIISLLGYSTGIHPTIWTGKSQEEHGMFTTFYYDPKRSPFKWTKWLKIIPTHFLRKNFIASLKAPYFWLPSTRPLIPHIIKKKIIPLPPSIPVDVAPYFSDAPIRLKDVTIFDLMKKKGIEWHWQTDAKGYKGVHKKLEDMDITDSDVDFFYLYKADEFGHISGPYSKRVYAYLRRVDAKIKDLYEKAIEAEGKVNLVVFSDHGMCEVKRFVDVQKAILDTGLVQGKDYIAFYDSTLARFWPKNETARKIIIKTLKKMKHITYLNKRLLKKYGIDFKNKKRYGEIMALPDPETRIFPDYFAPIKGGIKGWHGFDPNFEGSKGVLFTNLCLRKKEIKIAEMFRILKMAIGI